MQFDHRELIQMRHIASLRIHVEKAMECIKNFHIFDRALPATLTGIADRMFQTFILHCVSVGLKYVLFTNSLV
jgi:hypothetical protein